MRTRFFSILVFAILLALWANAGIAAPPYKGRQLSEVLAELESEGVAIIYNTQLIPEYLMVTEEPEPGDSLAVLECMLAPHDLTVEPGPGGRLLVTRKRDPREFATVMVKGRLIDSSTGLAMAGETVRLHPGGQSFKTADDGFFHFDDVKMRPTTLEVMSSGFLPLRRTLGTIDMRNGAEVLLAAEPLEVSLGKMTVTASHYAMMHADPASNLYLSKDEVDRLPHIADDVFRAVTNLPGIANGDFSARLNVRGGATDELLVVLDGMRLYNPYHLKDLLSIFSIIDSNAVDGVDFYSGAFPAQFGATNSAVMSINSISPDSEYRHQLGLSFINAFGQASGELADGQGYWLASARTGYLDVILKIIDPESGLDPTYFDLLGKTEMPVGDHSVLRFSTLLAADRSLVVDQDADISDADFVDAYGWLELETDLTPYLRIKNMVFAGHLERDKTASVDDGNRLQSQAIDQRSFDFSGIKSGIDWQASDALQLRAGAEARVLNAEYDYDGIGVINDLILIVDRELPEIRLRNSHLDPEGEAYSAFVSLRQDWTSTLTTEIGTRWDKQTYTKLADNDQTSPRFNLLYRIGERTQARLAWGRFFQPQEINQLQIEDGIETFFKASMADQAVVSLEHRTKGGVELRLEAYNKDYEDVRPYYENLFQEANILSEFESDRVLIAPDSARARGVELAARGGVPSGLQWWSSYTWSESEDRINGQWVPRSWDQRHAVNLGITFPVQRWDVTLAFRYHSGWPRTPVERITIDGLPVPVPVILERNSDAYAVYHRMDMRAVRDIPVSKGALRFYVEVINLYNRKNECCDDYDAFGNPTQVTFRKFDESWLPFTPSLGLKWEF